MARVFQVVDLFAGPGGLAEGFSSFADANGHSPFNIVLSVEKDASAHRTLLLRSFLRQFDGEFPAEYYEYLNHGDEEPDWPALYPEEWANAESEALHLELGNAAADRVIETRVRGLRQSEADAVVIGGPPCQAYSMAGRVRNKGVVGYVPEEDKRHFLYQEYIDILALLRPAAFVMENVKGLLSSSVDGGRIFGRVLEDLRSAGGEPETYQLFAIGKSPHGGMVLQTADAHEDYVVRAERFGVPQARHRLIIVGLRRDLAAKARGGDEKALGPPEAFAAHVLSGMPALRSGLTKGDSSRDWTSIVARQMEKVCDALERGEGRGAELVLPKAREASDGFFKRAYSLRRESAARSKLTEDCPAELSDFLQDPLLTATLNHATRGHMPDDLGRYFFVAVFTQVIGRSPKAFEFPASLAPAHANWSSGNFVDRFRAQRLEGPSTTITSHISKDGHYFIHPDPQQCRSLTVREAARLQTFPDNYLFKGNQTQQYVQVGNAVPPYLAQQIAKALWRRLRSA